MLFIILIVINSRTKLVLSVMKTALAVDLLRYLLETSICVRCSMHVRVNIWLETSTPDDSSKFWRIPATAFSAKLIAHWLNAVTAPLFQVKDVLEQMLTHRRCLLLFDRLRLFVWFVVVAFKACIEVCFTWVPILSFPKSDSLALADQHVMLLRNLPQIWWCSLRVFQVTRGSFFKLTAWCKRSWSHRSKLSSLQST